MKMLLKLPYLLLIHEQEPQNQLRVQYMIAENQSFLPEQRTNVYLSISILLIAELPFNHISLRIKASVWSLNLWGFV